MDFWWTTALLTGLASSLHCIGMCGPLAVALPVGRFSKDLRGPARGLYHLGRISAYGVLGALVGTVGQGLLLTGLQRPIAIGAGVLLLAWVLAARRFSAGLQSIALTRRLTAPLARLLRQPTLPHLLMLGFLNGLLPCGSVYVALAGALAMPSPLAGAGYLLAFGIGTLPAMLSVNVVVSHLTPKLRTRFGQSMPMATALVAIWLLVRGLGLPSTQSVDKSGQNAIPLCHGKLIGIEGK